MIARDILLAVRRRQRDALRDELGLLARGALGARGTVHFARLTVLDDRPRLGDAVLLVAVVFDGGDAELAEILGPLGAVWRYCEGYDPAPAAFAAWIAAHALTPPYHERCFEDPVPAVRAAVVLRRRIADFASDLQSERDPAVLYRRFAEAFPG